MPLTASEFATLMAPLGPFGTPPTIAAGVSGGPHSLALALLAQEWALSRGGRVLALIADHGLRPEAEEEALGVARLLAGQGIAAQVLRLGLSPGAAMQERARLARRTAMLAAAARWGAPWLLLGHHRGDQAETLAFRAQHGSGPAGLAGMAAVTAFPEGLLLRPLLSVPPARLEALLAARGIIPVRDPSNDNPRFTRVRLRQALADPGGTGPGTAALAEAARLFGLRRQGRAKAIAARLALAATPHPFGMIRLDRTALGDDGLAEATLSALVRLVAGAEHPPPRDGLRHLLAEGRGTLHGALWAGPWLMREPAAIAPPISAMPGATWDGRWRLAGDALILSGDLFGGLGDAASGFRACRPARGLPLAALRTLPALWRGGVPIVVPALLEGETGPFKHLSCLPLPSGGPAIASL